jgi:hypothetical protein
MLKHCFSIQKRMRIEDHNGQKKIVLKQGNAIQSAMYAILGIFCTAKIVSYFYLEEVTQSAPSHSHQQVIETALLIFLTIVFSWMSVCALAREVIEVENGWLIVNILIGKNACLSKSKYSIQETKDLKLTKRTYTRGSGAYWMIYFKYKGRQKRLETCFYTEEEGQDFIENHLRPMLAIQITPNTPSEAS